jgi:hypothetical protein
LEPLAVRYAVRKEDNVFTYRALLAVANVMAMFRRNERACSYDRVVQNGSGIVVTSKRFA